MSLPVDRTLVPGISGCISDSCTPRLHFTTTTITQYRPKPIFRFPLRLKFVVGVNGNRYQGTEVLTEAGGDQRSEYVLAAVARAKVSTGRTYVTVLHRTSHEE